MMETWQHKANFSRKHWAMLIATVSGLLFPLASILIIFVKGRVLFTIKNISRTHTDHPELFLLYLLPVISAVVVHFIYTRQQKKLGFLQKTIGKKDETIKRSAQFANEIGKGNYSVQIIPEGEQDVLGKSLLVMKENLLANYRKESVHNWISEGKNVISNILRISNKLEELGDHVLEHLVKYIDAIQGAIYLYNEEDDSLVSLSTYAYHGKKNIDQKFKVGYGLIGQCAYEKDYIYRTEIPEDYFTISSGLLGEQKPASLLIVPLISDDTLQGVVEIAFLSPEIPEKTIDLVKELGDFIARTIFNLRVTQEALKRSDEKLEAQVQELENAQRIQSSILPGIRQIQEFFPKCFIYYKPRDVISGDFPWFFPDGDLVYLAAVDCTGHGVPGALLSLVGYFLLNNIVDRQPGLTAGQICDKLHAGVRKTLKQESEDADARDGMDIALCKINLKSREIHYSGGQRPLYLMRKGELMEFKGDRKALGGIPDRKKPESPFTNHVIPYLAGDKIFFYSNGMPDQPGGPEIKKYSPGRISNIISDNPGFTMNQYKQYFAQDFEKWMQDTKQIDDVLLIGIEF
jgi:serine phosphatase RsbU (regulator of sigma subunit)